MAEKDPQLEIKKRARRRLVGAAAFALIAAVVLPMVMDAEPRPLTEDIQIRIPNPDATAALSRPLPVRAEGKAESPGPQADVVPLESDGGSVAAAAPAKPRAPDPAPAPPAAEAPSATRPAHAAPIAPDPQADTKPAAPRRAEGETASADAKAAPGTLSQGTSGEKSAKAADKSASPKSSVQSSAQFVVQLGTFGDAENARRVRAKAKGLGFDTYSEPLQSPDGSEKLRVRAGPFSSRAAADSARAKLATAGLAGVVTAKQ